MKHQTKKGTHSHRKRHGEHQKRTGHFLKVYTPYLPVVIFLFLSFWLLKPYYKTTAPQQPDVLAYATDIASNTLLTASNQKRAAAGVRALAFNGKLTSAAQEKANDMANRNYWSHNTPEGTPPWKFISDAGYSYSVAGENLAYGFRITNTNPSTNELGVIDGWMASPTHKENMLNGKFTEVGFGIANAPVFQGLSQQTIVVAMYAAPLSVASATTNRSTAPTPAPAPVATQNIQSSPQTTAQAVQDQNDDTKSSSTTTEPILTEAPKAVSRLEATTNKSLPWLLSTLFVVALSGGALLVTKHGYALHQYVKKGKKFILRNKLLDITIIAFIAFYIIASQTVVKVL